MRAIFLFTLAMSACRAFGIHYEVIAADTTASISHLSSVSGGTTFSTGYYRVTVGSIVVRQFFGSTYYSWSRQNTTGVTVVGYHVIVGAVDQEPDSEIPSYFGEAQVVWGNLDGPADDIPGGQG